MPYDPFARALTNVLLHQASEFVGVFDPRLGRLTQVNPAGVQLLGYATEAELLADAGTVPHTPALAPADWQALREQARRTGRQAVETAVVKPNGLTFQARLELTYFEVEGASFFLLRLSEQTRLHQAERELAQSVRRFEAVVANATIGIIVCNRRGHFARASHRGARAQRGRTPPRAASPVI
jgi:PAS domain-containing protein